MKTFLEMELGHKALSVAAFYLDSGIEVFLTIKDYSPSGDDGETEVWLLPGQVQELIGALQRALAEKEDGT